MKARVVFGLLVSIIVLGSAFAQQRSDAEIRAEVQRRIGRVAGVTIGVQNGVVTLTGSVSSLAERLNAANMARRTVGVREVVDRIGVVPAQRRSDEEITRSVREMLAGNLSKKELSAITVRAEKGVVILTGILPSSYPKHVAGVLVSIVPGVIDIRNEIVVRPPEPRTDAEILSDIGARYTRNPFVPEEQVNVSVTNWVVTLAGVVNSFLQAEQAESVARFAPGVVDVRNLLFVRAM